MATLFRRILVPHDFSPAADSALRVAADLARANGGKLVVLHAIAPFFAVPEVPLPDTFVPSPELSAQAPPGLDECVRPPPGAKPPPVRLQVTIAEPLDAILEAAATADCIVLATTGRTGLAHLVIGSVAAKVVRHSPILVLTLRATSAARARPGPKTRAKR